MPFRNLKLALTLGLVFLPAMALAQGVLVVVDPDQIVRLPRPIIIYPPHPPRPIPDPAPVSYKIKELAVQARLADQVARVNVSQSFVNTGSRQMEVSFIFPLPYDGAIDQLTLLVDGKEYPAKLLPAAEARGIYEAIVRKNKDPALLEWVGNGMFQTSVFPVPPGAERKVTLRYNQLCRKDHSLTDFIFPLSTARYTSQAVEKVDIRVAIESSTEIKNVYSPSHAIEIQRPDARHAIVSYVRENDIPSSDFRLFYDVAAGEVGTSVLSYRPKPDEDGFFLLLASPQIKAANAERLPKTVIFVVDRSGSMSGKKIEQAKNAVKFVLDSLREGDLFNIVAYDNAVESFRPELQKYDEPARKAAIGYVEGIYAGGSTNIDGALTSALNQLKDGSRPNYIIFLTDGLPTAGETNESKIVASAKSHNSIQARLISFGVGYDVNSRLLDRLSRANRGQSEFVRPDENIEASVGRLYSKISSPVMTDVAIKFEMDELKPEDGNAVNRVLPHDVVDLFEGEQLVLVGRYRKAGRAKVTISGHVGGQQQQLDFPADLVEKSPDESYGFVEKLWAMRRIGEIIDQLDLTGRNEELVKELVQLSTTHGILTPYTSFLADDQNNFRELSSNVRLTNDGLEALEKADGKAGFAQRAEKKRLQSASSPARAAAPAGQPAADGAAGPRGGGLGGAAVYRDAESDREVAAEAVKNIGNRAFYQRAADKRWIDSTVTEEMEKQAKRVTQFSDEYFQLARQHGKALAQYLALDEPVLVNLEGQAYFIDPAGKE
ncbi:MAG: VIT domain-containing protein [Pirellulales bacterium]